MKLYRYLSGVEVALTGKPPKRMTRQFFVNLLLKVYFVEAVRPTFTKRTRAVVHDASVETSILRKAREKGVYTVSYDNLLKDYKRSRPRT